MDLCAASGSTPGRSRKHVQPDTVPPVHVVPGGCDHGFHHQRDEQIRRTHQRHTLESALRDTHDGHGMPVDVDCAVHCGRIAAEPAPPVIVAQDHEWFAAFELVLIGSEQAAQRRRHAEHVEIVAGDQFGGGPLCRSLVGYVDRVLVSCGDAGEGIGRSPQIGIQRVRKIVLVAARASSNKLAGPMERDQTLGLLDWDHPQQDLIGQSEDGRVGADAERQGQDCGYSERRVSQQVAQSEFHWKVRRSNSHSSSPAETKGVAQGPGQLLFTAGLRRSETDTAPFPVHLR